MDQNESVNYAMLGANAQAGRFVRAANLAPPSPENIAAILTGCEQGVDRATALLDSAMNALFGPRPELAQGMNAPTSNPNARARLETLNEQIQTLANRLERLANLV